MSDNGKEEISKTNSKQEDQHPPTATIAETNLKDDHQPPTTTNAETNLKDDDHPPTTTNSETNLKNDDHPSSTAITETNSNDDNHLPPTATAETNVNGVLHSPTTAIADEDNGVVLSPEMVQKKLYFLVNQLKEMHAQIPVIYQVRISYELLTELANFLLRGGIFSIVTNLLEIQHVTETHLKKQRDDVEKANEIETQDWISKITDKEELEHLLGLLKIKHAKKLRETDMEIVMALDQKRKEQQSTMQMVGAPGFYETGDVKEIKIQMFLFDFMLRLCRTKFDPNKLNWFLQE